MAGAASILLVVLGYLVGVIAVIGLKEREAASDYFAIFLVMFLIVGPLIEVAGFIAALMSIRRNSQPHLGSAALVLSGIAALLWLTLIVTTLGKLRVG